MSSVANTQKFLEGLRIQGRSDDSLDTVADFTEDFSETTPTTWTEDSSSGYANNLEPYKSSTNGLWFDMDYNSSVKTSGTLDLANAGLVGSNVSDTQWTFRFKFNVTSGSGSGTVWVGLSDNTNAVDTAQRFIGCRIKDSSGFSCGADNGGQAMNVSNATNGGATSISDATDYYVTVERKTATLFTATIRTGSHTGTVLGTGDDTTISSSHDDLRYFKVMNHMAGSSGQIQGYIYDLEIYDDTNTLSIAKDKSTITNVPIGTRYEEVDTRKIYRWKDEGFSTDGIGTWGDLISNEAGTLTNPTDAPAGLATAGNTKCWNSTALAIKSRTGMDGNTARTFIPSGTDWTFAFWYNSNNWATGGSNSPAIFNAKNSSGTTRMWFEFASGPNAPSGDEPQFNVQYYGNGSPSSNGAINHTGTLSTGNWHWMCIDYDTSAGTITWRVDNTTSGVGFKTDTEAGITSINIDTIDYWLVGATAEAYNGKLTDMCIWNTILDSTARGNIFGDGGSTATLATTQAKSNITWYHDCQSITFPITNKATSPGWVEKGTA